MHTHAATTGPHILALQGTALIFAVSAPNAIILVGVQCGLQAFIDDSASTANSLGLFNLLKGWTSVADGEEKLGILIAARRFRPPILGTAHGSLLLQ